LAGDSSESKSERDSETCKLRNQDSAKEDFMKSALGFLSLEASIFDIIVSIESLICKSARYLSDSGREGEENEGLWLFVCPFSLLTLGPE
jgi:hypothetical protein